MAPALLLRLAALASALAAPAPEAASTRFTAKPGNFRIDVPAGWETIEETVHLEQEVRFLGPFEPNGVFRTTVFAYFFPDGTVGYETAAAYIGRSSLGDDARRSKSKRITVAGLPARRFKTDRNASLHDNRFLPRQYRHVNDQVVIPVPGGYYVLNFSTEREAYRGLLPLFEKMLASFRLTGKPPVAPVNAEKIYEDWKSRNPGKKLPWKP